MEKLSKLIALFCLSASASFSSYGALVSHSGYTLNTDTDVVSGGGLEWLQWDKTAGVSVSNALTSYSGWRLASVGEMNGLLSSFSDNPSVYSGSNTSGGYADVVSESGFYFDTFAYSAVDTGNDQLIGLFGNTWFNEGDLFGPGDDAALAIRAIYGFDIDGDGKHKGLQVRSDFSFFYPGVADKDSRPGTIEIQRDNLNSNTGYDTYGVALVRDAKAVPELSASVAPLAALLMSLLLCLGVERRRKLNKA